VLQARASITGRRGSAWANGARRCLAKPFSSFRRRVRYKKLAWYTKLSATDSSCIEGVLSHMNEKGRRAQSKIIGGATSSFTGVAPLFRAPPFAVYKQPNKQAKKSNSRSFHYSRCFFFIDSVFQSVVKSEDAPRRSFHPRVRSATPRTLSQEQHSSHAHARFRTRLPASRSQDCTSRHCDAEAHTKISSTFTPNL
jgi:hypothetical protein